MGFLDFLKEKKTDELFVVKSSRLECDQDKTKEIVELLKTPKENRDEKWNELFLENIQTARFSESLPQLIIGPDKFPYFVLKSTENFNPFESFCIVNMSNDFLLEKGFGVVINPHNNDADWVFSYGDILNLHLNNEFFSKTGNSHQSESNILETDTEVLISQPSEKYLPAFAKNAIKLFLLKNGIKQPKMMMISRPVNGVIVQELVFNLFIEDFNSNDDLKIMIHRLSWFLPKHYRILSISQKSGLIKNFENL